MKKSNQLIVAAMFVTGFCGTAVAEEVACGAKACLTTTDPTTLENKYFEAELKCKTGVDEFDVASGWTEGKLSVTDSNFYLTGTSTTAETCAINGDAFVAGKTEVKCVDANKYKIEAEIKAVDACEVEEEEEGEEGIIVQ